MKAITEDEAERDKLVERRSRDRDRDEAPLPPTGFGIREALQNQTRGRRAPVEDEPASQPQVVIHTGSSGGSSETANVTQLATYIAKGGPTWQRDARRKEALNIIASTTTDVEERHQLEKALDDKVASLTGEPRDLMSRIKQGLFG